MPFGLTRYTRPFAAIVPAISDVAVPVTRLRMAAWAFGWSKRTVLPCATEKLSQLMMACADVCRIVALRALSLEIAAFPATTVPPWGSAVWASAVGAAIRADVFSSAATSRLVGAKRRVRLSVGRSEITELRIA